MQLRSKENCIVPGKKRLFIVQVTLRGKLRLPGGYLLENRRNAQYFIKDFVASSCVLLLSSQPKLLREGLCEPANQQNTHGRLQHRGMNAQQLRGVFQCK